MQTNGLIAKAILDPDDLAQVRELQVACEAADGFRVKFNWEMMADRDVGLANDFCYYDKGRLVGYAPLDGFGALYEITAAVLPEFRGHGVFAQLFDAARAEAVRRRARRILLVAYRVSSEIPARSVRSDIPYAVSEYHMEATVRAIPAAAQTEFALVDVDAAHVADLSRLTAIAFGIDHARNASELLDEITDPTIRYYLAIRDGIAIGQIGVVVSSDEVYIRGFGILPEFRRRGYGRQLLASVIERMYSEGYHRFSLDVETQNADALSLYISCGFTETMIYDYYTAL